MFRDAYKRDNELIKPDAAFLERMTQSLGDMQKEDMAGLQEAAQSGKASRKNQKEYLGVLRFTAVAACMVFLAVAFLWSGNTWSGADYKNGGLKSKIVVNQDTKQYEQLKEMLSKSVTIYQQSSDFLSEEKGQELTEDETNMLINDIMADALSVISEEAELNNPVYYMAEDSKGNRIWFATDMDGNIWVH